MAEGIKTPSNPGCTFRRLLRNKDQSKPHALTSYKRYTLTAPKHKKNNDFRLIIGRLSQKGKNNLKLLFARRLCLPRRRSQCGVLHPLWPRTLRPGWEIWTYSPLPASPDFGPHCWSSWAYGY